AANIVSWLVFFIFCFFFQAEDGIRDFHVTGVQTCALPISCFEDYHAAIENRLERLMRFLEDEAGRPIAWRSLVDTSPAVDRAVAEQAGAGAFGKNGCLFVEGAGSWDVLGAVVPDLHLEPDQPAALDYSASTRYLY